MRRLAPLGHTLLDLLILSLGYVMVERVILNSMPTIGGLAVVIAVVCLYRSHQGRQRPKLSGDNVHELKPKQKP